MTESKTTPPPPGEPARWRSSHLLPIVPFDKGKEKTQQAQTIEKNKREEINEKRETVPGPSALTPARAPPAHAPLLVLAGTSRHQ